MSGFDHIEVYPTQGEMGEVATSLEAHGLQLTKIVRPHHTTIDTTLQENFKILIEPEPLIQKIIRDEIRA